MELRFSIDQLPAVVAKFWQTYGNRKVFALQGSMGAGKTTFVHALCDLLGVEDPVSSPTFSIINQYQTAADKPFYHVDLYRLKDIDEALSIGIEELIYSGQLCFIEWPGLIKDLLPDGTCWIDMTALSGNERLLKVS
jgi:tRNA threonylcarbamoyladenosine biosynthesis protein TsaE